MADFDLEAVLNTTRPRLPGLAAPNAMDRSMEEIAAQLAPLAPEERPRFLRRQLAELEREVAPLQARRRHAEEQLDRLHVIQSAAERHGAVSFARLHTQPPERRLSPAVLRHRIKSAIAPQPGGRGIDYRGRVLASPWFDFRGFDDRTNADVVAFGRELIAEGLLRLPFDECVFLVPVHADTEGSFVMIQFLRQGGNGIETIAQGAVYGQGHAFLIDATFGDQGTIHLADDVVFLLAAMSSKSAEVRRGAPRAAPADAGGFIGDSYHEVTLRDRYDTVCGSGHHASPRLHWRRGHIRTVASGKRTWIAPMLVGDARRGTIIHDYRAETTSVPR